MERCHEQTSLLDEFSHCDHNNDQLLLVLDYADEILHTITFKTSSSSGLSRELSLEKKILLILDHETLRRFDGSLLCCCDIPRTLDKIIETDLLRDENNARQPRLFVTIWPSRHELLVSTFRVDQISSTAASYKRVQGELSDGKAWFLHSNSRDKLAVSGTSFSTPRFNCDWQTCDLLGSISGHHVKNDRLRFSQ
ncbi:hypothetical protein YC2023_098123 [Brassica napus]